MKKFVSKRLTTLTNDAQEDLGDTETLIPILKEIDEALSDMEKRLTALET